MIHIKKGIQLLLFLVTVWLKRHVLPWCGCSCLATFIEPWPLEPILSAAIGQLVASDLLTFRIYAAFDKG